MPPKTKQTKQAANKNSAKPQAKQQKKLLSLQRMNKGQKKTSSGETKRPAASHLNTNPTPMLNVIGIPLLL
jgi:hypothetical protein